MPVYVSMLRGINVGGNGRIKMNPLRASLTNLGLENISTYIQSGNVVFRSRERSSSKLSKAIEEIILQDFGHTVPVFIRSADQMAEVLTNNPFLKETGVGVERLHVSFLSDTPAPAATHKLSTIPAGLDRFHLIGKELYLHLPKGVAKSMLLKNSLDRILGGTATMRNWRTVVTLQQMARDCR